MKSILMVIALFASTNAFAASQITLTLKSSEMNQFNLTSEKEAVGTTSTVNTAVKILGAGELAWFDSDIALDPAVLRNEVDLKVNDDKVVFTQRGSNKTQSLNADVSRKLFSRKLKSLTVPSAEMEKVLTEAMKDEAERILRRLNLFLVDGDFTYTVKSSPMNCGRVDASLTCSVNSEIVLKAVFQ